MNSLPALIENGDSVTFATREESTQLKLRRPRRPEIQTARLTNFHLDRIG